MIAKCSGFTIGKYKIPPFELNKGELVGIHLHSGAHFFDLEMELVNLFMAKKAVSELELNQKFEFVEYFRGHKWQNFFYPVTVNRYLKTHGNPKSKDLYKVYEIDDYINPKTKVISLAGTPRKLLSLFTALSKSHYIVFDLVGVDPSGAEKILDIVNDYVRKGKTAILLDNYDDYEPKCTKFLRVEIVE